MKDHVVHNDGRRRHRLLTTPPRRVRPAVPPSDPGDDRVGAVYRAPRWSGVPAMVVYMLCVVIGAVMAVSSGLALLVLYLAYR